MPKISELPAETVLTGDEVCLVVKNGVTSKTTVGALWGPFLKTNMPYADAAALTARPVVPAGASIRIYGGSLADPDPTWMALGDYRHIPSAT